MGKVYVNPDHSSQLLAQISMLWKRDKYCDAALNLGSTRYKLHKLVLVAACPDIMRLLLHTEENNVFDFYVPSGHDRSAVESVLKYLYEGVIEITQANVNGIDTFSQNLQLQSLIRYCMHYKTLLKNGYCCQPDNGEQVLSTPDSMQMSDDSPTQDCAYNINMISSGKVTVHRQSIQDTVETKNPFCVLGAPAPDITQDEINCQPISLLNTVPISVKSETDTSDIEILEEDTKTGLIMSVTAGKKNNLSNGAADLQQILSSNNGQLAFNTDTARQDFTSYSSSNLISSQGEFITCSSTEHHINQDEITPSSFQHEPALDASGFMEVFPVDSILKQYSDKNSKSVTLLTSNDSVKNNISEQMSQNGEQSTSFDKTTVYFPKTDSENIARCEAEEQTGSSTFIMVCESMSTPVKDEAKVPESNLLDSHHTDPFLEAPHSYHGSDLHHGMQVESRTYTGSGSSIQNNAKNPSMSTHSVHCSLDDSEEDMDMEAVCDLEEMSANSAKINRCFPQCSPRLVLPNIGTSLTVLKQCLKENKLPTDIEIDIACEESVGDSMILDEIKKSPYHPGSTTNILSSEPYVDKAVAGKVTQVGKDSQALTNSQVNKRSGRQIQPESEKKKQLQIITFAEADLTGSSELGHLVDGAKKNTTGHVDRAKKNTAGHVILDKRQYCYICQQPILKLARHLLTVHKKEPKIIKLTVLKEKKKIGDYLKSLKELRALGNFVHNVKELQKGGSNIVVVKRPNKERPASDFLPCPHCYGFYVIDELWRHSRVCEFNSDSGKMEEAKEEHKYVIASARILLESASFEKAEVRSIPDDLQAHVLVNAKHDAIYKTIISDSLILTFGAILLKKLGPRKANDISKRMRQLGRLSMTLKSQLSEKLPLGRYISGGHFDKVVKAVEELCGLHITSDGRRGFSTPSLAVRLGHLLMKFANVKRGVCLRSQDTGGTEEAEAFISLHKSEWTDTISSNALNSPKRMKDQQISLLPLTQDLTKIHEHHKRVIKMYLDSLSSDQNYSTWRKLSQVIMSRLILFNKRRSGEVSRLLLHTYTQRPVWSELANKEIMSSLQPLERELMKRVDLVQIPGKKNRKVPLLITSDMKPAMDVLVANRETVGIPEDNPYFFASKSSSGYLDSWQAMNAIVQEAGVQHPELVKSTRIRKYNATVCQLFDLTPGELEWLANHMGHDINIHKDFYRLHDSTVEIAKVSCLLLAIDSGNAAKFQGKRLQDIGIDDFDEEDIDNEDNDFIQEDEEIDSESEEDVNRTLATGGNIQEDNEIESEDELCTTLASGRNIQEDEDTDIESEEDLNKTLAIAERSTTTQKKERTERKRPAVIRDSSSDEEKPQRKRIQMKKSPKGNGFR